MASQIRLDNRVAIVTGAGRGLGRSHALLMAQRGARVVVNDVGAELDGTGADRSVAQSVVDEIKAAGGAAVANYDSVATPQGARRIVQTALDAFGTVDIVVNNAGAIRKKPFLEHTAEDLAALIAVHQAGSLFVSQAAFEVMMKKRYGRFIFTTSVGGLRGNQYVAAYGSAKAGIVGLAYVVALAGAAHGIAANVISPYGYSRMGNAPHTQVDPSRSHVTRAELVSPAVVYLASEECKLNHEILTVGGGAVARTVIALGPGWRAAPGEELTAEAIRDHLDQIMDVSRFSNPLTSDDEGALFLGPAMAAQRR
ncbi:MAG TPA: SDR family NAD(P)-dependent oxidoreductase [Candidatus Binataceae bacterium]|jgi:NAD(P)-dependent dehydrogenase (short-subunit alcohol dehydrogenase family)|nr:SDR family NAD(P)-dependent oxidoreductase [Candidatus Binataceae bacterium]